MKIEDVKSLAQGVSGTDSGDVAPIDPVPVKVGVGILMRDGISQRLVEAAAAHLGLVPVTLDVYSVDSKALSELELIVVDRSISPQIRSLMSRREEGAEGINPALVVVTDRRLDAASQSMDGAGPAIASSEWTSKAASIFFDGELVLPLEPAALVTQLSLILYAHRAFARRYHSALEELNLNRRIFRSVTSGISVANARLPDLPLVYVNPAFEVMTGYALEEVQGKNCRFLQSEDTNQPGRTLIREAIGSGREMVTVIKNYRKDGVPFWNELSLSPIRNRHGELTHFVGIQTDVTARVEFEAALRESEKLAAVGRLASSIAHEINNPLESVMNLLFLARRADDLADIKQYLGVADKELQRVALITAQSLRFYKQSSKPQATKCADLLDSVVDLYSGRMLSANVTCEVRDRTTRSIVCLESELRQVLNNLIRNAIDAMRGRGGRLLIRSRDAVSRKTGSPGVTITIADTGSGISAETMKQLFTPFFTTKGIGGTGLGLWISSEIVDRHQGRLKVRSSQRAGCVGTVFELFLPSQGVQK